VVMLKITISVVYACMTTYSLLTKPSIPSTWAKQETHSTRRAAAEEGRLTEDIGGEGLVDQGGGELGDGAHAEHASIVDEDVDAAMDAEGLGDGGVAGGVRIDVEGEERDRGRAGGRRRRGMVGGEGGHGVEGASSGDDMAACAQELEGEGMAHAASRAAGDENHRGRRRRRRRRSSSSHGYGDLCCSVLLCLSLKKKKKKKYL
jgi:hypothetical protein